MSFAAKSVRLHGKCHRDYLCTEDLFLPFYNVVLKLQKKSAKQSLTPSRFSA
jgi:hypothetical protein